MLVDDVDVDVDVDVDDVDVDVDVDVFFNVSHLCNCFEFFFASVVLFRIYLP